MAKKTIAKYYSDLTNEEIAGGVPTIKFGLDGTTYEIDLTENEQKDLRGVLEQYIEAGRKVTGSRKTTGTSSGPLPKDVREWAKENGLDVPARGRIPASITEAYQAAH